MNLNAHPSLPLASAWGCGLFPFASGTFTCAMMTVIALILNALLPPSWLMVLWLVVAFFCTILGLRATQKVLASNLVFQKNPDPSFVVIDECAGQALVFAAASTTLDIIAAFFLFRFFDISKLPPVNLLERLPAEWGVMMDDVMAGIYGAAVLLIASAYGIW